MKCYSPGLHGTFNRSLTPPTETSDPQTDPVHTSAAHRKETKPPRSHRTASKSTAPPRSSFSAFSFASTATVPTSAAPKPLKRMAMPGSPPLRCSRIPAITIETSSNGQPIRPAIRSARIEPNPKPRSPDCASAGGSSNASDLAPHPALSPAGRGSWDRF